MPKRKQNEIKRKDGMKGRGTRVQRSQSRVKEACIIVYFVYYGFVDGIQVTRGWNINGEECACHISYFYMKQF